MKPARTLQRGCLSIAFGLGVTVGVAWMFAFIDVTRGSHVGADRVDHLRRTAMNVSGYCRGGAVFLELDPMELRADDWRLTQPLPADAASGRLGRWAISWGLRILADDPESRGKFVDARGWPLPALWCEYAFLHDTEPMLGVRGGISVRGIDSPKGIRTYGGAPVAIPLRPIWSGLAINALFFAVLWWAVLLGPGAVRRWLRARRSACVRCGYDLRGLPEAGCPECGWRRANGVIANGTC